jgi:hypothetical protein
LPLGGGFLVPLPRLCTVVGNALAISMEQVEMVLCDGLSLGSPPQVLEPTVSPHAEIVYGW